MSAMSASSGLMPLSLISEHKAAQGGPQQLAFSPEKHSLVQAPKPTPNGMEQSPPLVSLPQPQPQPSLPCGGIIDGGRGGGEGDVVPEIGVAEPSAPPLGELAPPVVDLPPAVEPPSQPAPPPLELPPAPATASLPPAPAAAPNTVHESPAQPLSAQLHQLQVSQQDEKKPPVEGGGLPVEPAPGTGAPDETPADLPKPGTLPQDPSPPPLPEATTPEPEPVPPPQGDQPLEGASQPPKAASQPPKAASQPPKAASQPPKAANPSPPPAADPSQPPPSAPRLPKRAKAQTNANEKKAEAASSSIDTSENEEDKKAKRKRLPTQVYQSPIPEENIIAKITKIDKTPAGEDKLIVFYKNEFLAVRNAEGSFYVCQSMQNVYKSSAKIKIRWLSQVENTDYYSPDFYDNTEFDCILTNLNMERIEKNKFRLPDIEAQRTQSILKRALDVENGVAPPEDSTVTEEHPDGLDLSLYRNEEQLKKRKSSSKSRTSKKKAKKATPEVKKAIREVPKRTKAPEVKKPVVTAASQSKRVTTGRITKVDKPVVQRIVAAKMGRRKAGTANSKPAPPPPPAPAKEAPKKKETPRNAAVKRKSTEPPATSVSEKKQKTGTSKTKNV